MDYPKEVFHWHTGIDNTAEKAPEAVAAAFVVGFQPKIQEQLRFVAVVWQTKPLN